MYVDTEKRNKIKIIFFIVSLFYFNFSLDLLSYVNFKQFFNNI